MSDTPRKKLPAVSFSPTRTLVVAIDKARQAAALRWVRGVLVGGVAAGVLAAIKFFVL